MLKVFSASTSERFACSQAKRTTDGMGQVPKSTSAFTPAGKARFRFSVMAAASDVSQSADAAGHLLHDRAHRLHIDARRRKQGFQNGLWPPKSSRASRSSSSVRPSMHTLRANE